MLYWIPRGVHQLVYIALGAFLIIRLCWRSIMIIIYANVLSVFTVFAFCISLHILSTIFCQTRVKPCSFNMDTLTCECYISWMFRSIYCYDINKFSDAARCLSSAHDNILFYISFYGHWYCCLRNCTIGRLHCISIWNTIQWYIRMIKTDTCTTYT